MENYKIWKITKSYPRQICILIGLSCSSLEKGTGSVKCCEQGLYAYLELEIITLIFSNYTRKRKTRIHENIIYFLSNTSVEELGAGNNFLRKIRVTEEDM